jgi:hypothetical protein
MRLDPVSKGIRSLVDISIGCRLPALAANLWCVCQQASVNVIVEADCLHWARSLASTICHYMATNSVKTYQIQMEGQCVDPE